MEKVNKFLKELNGMIRHMFENKIFLIHMIIAIITVTLGIMANLTTTQLVILVIAIAASLRTSIHYSLAEDEKRKLSLGAMMLFNAICALVIGYLLFIQASQINLITLYEKISNSYVNVCLLALIIPVTISISAKIILKSGEPLSGGIISGHATYCITVYLLSINQHKAFAFLLILPILTIIIPRYLLYKYKVWPPTLVTAVCIAYLLLLKANIIIILANIILGLLVFGSKDIKPVHKKREITYGIIIATISTILILFIFNRINMPF